MTMTQLEPLTAAAGWLGL